MTSATQHDAVGGLPPGPAPRAREGRLSDVLAGGLFLVLPLAVSPGLEDPYTSVKWIVLEAVALAWFLAELWGHAHLGWPAFVRARWRLVLVLAALLLASSLRSGLAGAGPVLLDRLCFVLLALASFWHFRRNRGRAGSIVGATSASAALTVVVGLAQVLGRQPVPFLSGGDERSAFFGNVNLTAQFLGFALILLLSASPPLSPARARTRAALATACLVYLYFLSCRSVLLGLALAVSVLVVSRRLALATLGRQLGAATAAVLLLVHFGPLLGDGSPLRHLLSREVLTEKALSSEWRLIVWRSTLDLIRDHPLGVGSGSFGDAFIPYQLGLDLIPGERVLFRAPHNEYLRVVAEEGVVFAVVAALLLVSVLRRLRAGPRAGWWRSDVAALLVAGTVFLTVEAFFQFPLGTPFGCLVAAVLLGLALAALEPAAPETIAAGDPLREPRLSISVPRPRRWRALGTFVAVAALVFLGRIVTSEILIVSHRRDAAAMEAACRLEPRNLPACVTAAWLRIRSGERLEGRRLLVRTLERSPYYHPAVRLLGEEAASAGDRPRACRYLWIYDQLFRGRSGVHARVGVLCEDAPPVALPAGVAMPFYGEFPFAAKDAALR